MLISNAGLNCPVEQDRFGVGQLKLSLKQEELAKAHGTPSEFACACYRAVPSFISMDEASEAIERYNREWASAAYRLN